jgi:hypothetical protein
MEETPEKSLHYSSYDHLEKQILVWKMAALFHLEMLDYARNLPTDCHPLAPPP